ncbi:MAG: hypothetical protein K0B06_00200 [Brevefilum sp.]|nr:hypothetical protein [Brevefilum sp.]
MNTKYHIEITRKALESHFSSKALERIIKANVRQDRVAYMLGHDHIHFDGSEFSAGFRYIADQERMLIQYLEQIKFQQAQQAFGRIIHSWQDLYSHSNYVQLWRQTHAHHAPDTIVANNPDIISHPNFASGKNYGMIEFLALIPVLSPLITPRMPSDSHAKMNLDSPASGPDFHFAYWAAYKATQAAYENLIEKLIQIDPSQKITIHFKEK